MPPRFSRPADALPLPALLRLALLALYEVVGARLVLGEVLCVALVVLELALSSHRAEEDAPGARLSQ